MSGQRNEYRLGVWYAIGCYGLWGLFPLYWYAFTDAAIGADQILAQRVLWSMVFAAVLLLITRRVGVLLDAMRNPRLLMTFTVTALLIGLNWLQYIWAIVNGHVLEASLGYFISPLASVMMGQIFFGERLNRLQWMAVGLAIAGIVWLAIPAGRVPWVALTIALTFSFYSAVRKRTTLDALSAMSLETLLILPFAIGYLLWCQHQGTLVFGQLTTLQQVLIMCSGIITIVPLLFFTGAVKRIPLSLLGMMQYFSPTLQLALGLLVFGEAFNVQQFVGYSWVWAGVACFMLGLWRRNRRQPPLR